MAWRLAKSLIRLREQVNAAYPNRDKRSDGSIGDPRHAKTKSDHNPNSAGVVTAIDIDKDLSDTVNVGVIVDALVASRDARLTYLIWRGRIISSKVQPWVWRKYTGANGHFEHVHVSVDAAKALYDDDSDWNIAVPIGEVNISILESSSPRPILRMGSKGSVVKTLQTLLNNHGAALKADGDYGPKTHDAVVAFQKKKGLTADGIVGPKTYAALGL